jgi:hypothetical protein
MTSAQIKEDIMSARSNYFAKAPLRGVGKMHFLVTPQEAGVGSAPRSLLGSLVKEIDVGLFSLREVPGLEHTWKREYVLNVLRQDPALQNVPLVEEVSLANVSQELKVEKKFKLGIDANVPGVPVSGTIGIDFSKVRKVIMELGAGCKKFYIPEDFLKSGYAHAQENSNQFDKQLFDDDRMAVSQIVVVKKMKVTVESESNFTADFQAKATDINGLGIGVTYEKKTEKKYEIDLDDGKEYLFAIRAVQLDNL